MIAVTESRILAETNRISTNGTTHQPTLRETIASMSAYLKGYRIDAPLLDAQIIVTRALGLERIDAYRNPDRPVTPEEEAAVRSLIGRRASGIPTAYIIGEKEFWSMTVSVDPRVLIPRPETELLVEESLIAARHLPQDALILEIGTGSGAISIALAMELVAARIVSTDISDDSLAVAMQNFSDCGVIDRISIRTGDLFGAVGSDERFDLIVSNPPYLSNKEMEDLSTDVRAEPPTALCGGKDGLSIIERLIRNAPPHLANGGVLIIEIGAGQQDDVKRLIDNTPGLTFSHIRRDYAGHPRIVVSQRTEY